MALAIGDQVRLLRDFGNQEFDPIGVRHGLQAGAIGTVVLEVAAAEQGAHNREEDALVLEFEDTSRRIAASGELEQSEIRRRVSFGLADFEAGNPDRLFEALY